MNNVMQEAALRQDTLTETYQDVRLLMFKIIHEVWKKYDHKFEFDDLVSQANLEFIGIVDQYDATKGSLTNWIYFNLKNALIDYIHEQIRETHRSFDPVMHGKSHNPTGFSEYMMDLSQDARDIVTLIFDPPEAVKNIAKQRRNHQGNIKTAIETYLFHCLDWPGKRIQNSFREIQSILG